MDLSNVIDKIVESAFRVVEYKSAIAFNEVDDLDEGYTLYNNDAMDYIVNLAKPLLTTAGQTKKIEAQSAAGVLKMLASGKLSPTEASAMMMMLKNKVELEDKEMQAQMQEKLMKMVM